MNVNVNQPGKDRLADSFDHFCSYRLGIRSSSVIHFGNFSVSDQHGSIFNDLAVADEDARSSNQISVAAGKLPVQNFRLRDAAAGMHLPRAQQQKWSQHR